VHLQALSLLSIEACDWHDRSLFLHEEQWAEGLLVEELIISENKSCPLRVATLLLQLAHTRTAVQKRQLPPQ
jgi:hypothetical protein